MRTRSMIVSRFFFTVLLCFDGSVNALTIVVVVRILRTHIGIDPATHLMGDCLMLCSFLVLMF